jgi:hypothetical protein
VATAGEPGGGARDGDVRSQSRGTFSPFFLSPLVVLFFLPEADCPLEACSRADRPRELRERAGAMIRT